jgi:hypothetical protein
MLPIFFGGNEMQSLIEAYKGYYDGEMEALEAYEAYLTTCEGEAESYDGWFATWIADKIASDGPKDRLAIYLEWHGILGYTETIWAISQGEY